MIELNIKTKLDELTKGFNIIQRMQVPWAMSLTLARLGNISRDLVAAEMEEVFDRPTSFTKKGVRVAWITKDPDAWAYRVFLNEWAGKGTAPVKYLYPEVEGGQRNETRFERALRFAGRLPAGMGVVPGQGAPMDAYGNVRNGFHSTVLSMLRASTDPFQNQTEKSKKRKARPYQAKLFVGRPGGGRLPLGIYQRLGMRPLFIFVKGRPSYTKRLRFHELVQWVFETKLQSEFQKAFADAMRTR
jgi:hypothetical protein